MPRKHGFRRSVGIRAESKRTGEGSSYRYYITPEEYATAAANGIRRELVNERVRKLAWGVERAITTPPEKQKDRSFWRKIAEENGISRATFYSRCRRVGWTEEMAATIPLADKVEVLKRVSAERPDRVVPAEYMELAKKNGLERHIYMRVTRCGWSLEEAATTPILSREECGRLGGNKAKHTEAFKRNVKRISRWLFPHRARTTQGAT